MKIFEHLELLVYAVIIIAGVVGSLIKKKKIEIPMPDTELELEPDTDIDMDTDTAPVLTSTSKPASVKTSSSAPPQKAKPVDECEWERAMAEREARHALKAAFKEAAKNAPSAHQELIVTEDDVPINALASQARTGFVWSEILLPPVSMR